MRPNLRFVPQKSVKQQDLQCLHRVRSRLVACRTQLINQVCELLAEYGIVLPHHLGQVRNGLPSVLEDGENQLTGFGGGLFRDLYEEPAELDEKIADADDRIQIAFLIGPGYSCTSLIESPAAERRLPCLHQGRRKGIRVVPLASRLRTF